MLDINSNKFDQWRQIILNRAYVIDNTSALNSRITPPTVRVQERNINQVQWNNLIQEFNDNFEQTLLINPNAKKICAAVLKDGSGRLCQQLSVSADINVPFCNRHNPNRVTKTPQKVCPAILSSGNNKGSVCNTPVRKLDCNTCGRHRNTPIRHIIALDILPIQPLE